MDRLAVKLSFDPGEKFPFALRNTEALERLFDLQRNIFPIPLRRVAGREVITNAVEINFLEFVACPVRRQRFAQKDVVSLFAERANPIWLALHIGDIIDGLLRQADTCVASWFETIKEVADIAVNINLAGTYIHFVLSRRKDARLTF